MQAKCEYRMLSFKNHEEFYGCYISDQNIFADTELQIFGKHAARKTNNDVLHVKFGFCKVTKIPQGLTKKFPNMNILNFTCSKLKSICKKDLIEYKNMTRLIFIGNHLEFLPGDLLQDFKNLIWVDFNSNRIKNIEPNFLDGLQNLKHVNFLGNPNYNTCYSIYPAYSSNSTVQEIIENLYESYVCSSKNCDDLIIKKINVLTKKMENYEEKIENLESEVHNFRDNSIFSDVENYINNEHLKDFTIEIDDRKFLVHKFLLSVRCPTIAEMLHNNPDAKNLKLIDISIKIFDVILKFIYTDKLPIDDGTDFICIFTAASRLRIEKLKQFAALELKNQINAENALEILELSTKYGHDELREKALEVLRNNNHW